MNRRVLVSAVLPAAVLSVLGCLGMGSANAAEEQTGHSAWMLGDWGGARTRLQERGYDFNIGYVGEVGGLLDGGYSDDHIGRYSHQFAAGMHMDLEKVFGWHAAEFQVTLTERGGRNLSNVGIADPRAGQLSSVQEVWGRGQRWRLTQLWFKQKYFGDRQYFNQLHAPDFQQLAEAMGMRAWKLDASKDFDAVLQAAVAHPGPVLVEVDMDSIGPLNFAGPPQKKLY